MTTKNFLLDAEMSRYPQDNTNLPRQQPVKSVAPSELQRFRSLVHRERLGRVPSRLDRAGHNPEVSCL